MTVELVQINYAAAKYESNKNIVIDLSINNVVKL